MLRGRVVGGGGGVEALGVERIAQTVVGRGRVLTKAARRRLLCRRALEELRRLGWPIEEIRIALGLSRGSIWNYVKANEALREAGRAAGYGRDAD